MTEYRATEDDMKEYARILRTIAALDIQRDQVLQALASWEQAHRVEEPAAEISAEDPVDECPQ